MGQGLIGGATSYEEQSLSDILGDINRWLQYALDSKSLIIEYKEQLEDDYWNKIPWNFKLTILSTLTYLDTILYDLSLIKTAIIDNNITTKEVNLLRNIGINASKKNVEYGQTYNEHNCFWHDYENPQFRIAEKIYCEGRDFFVTLIDAGNAAHRLEDYMEKGHNTKNTLNVKGDIYESQIQLGTDRSMQTMVEDRSFNYEQVLEALEKIQRTFSNPDFTKDLNENAENVKSIVEEAINMAREREKPSRIKVALSTIKDLAIGAGGGIIANAIFGIITQLNIL